MLVDPVKDRVTVRGRPVSVSSSHRYLLVNKPEGYVVTARDPSGRPTVFELLGAETAGPRRLFHVGRLDVATTGLLLLTDDGELANQLAHPAKGVEKEYLAVVRGRPDESDLGRLRRGIELEDGFTAPAEAEVVARRPGGHTELRLVLTEGRNRQVRRMLDAVGHPALALARTRVGPVRLGRLRPGGVRRLRTHEVAALRRAAGL
jgi:pseudouridine synthase